jgi:hypothetical protein
MKPLAVVLALAAGLCVDGNLARASPIAGPGVSVSRAQAFGSVWFNETFRGGETAVVTIRGDGDTDLDLYVYDANGNLVAWSNGPTDRETVRFTPLWTGRFRIEVRNLGRVWNQFTLNTY